MYYHKLRCTMCLVHNLWKQVLKNVHKWMELQKDEIGKRVSGGYADVDV